MSLTPPNLPSPGGWRQPRSLVPSAPSPRVALAGLVPSVLATSGATVLIINAWHACGHFAHRKSIKSRIASIPMKWSSPLALT